MLVPAPGPGRVEPEHGHDAAVAAQRHVDRRADLLLLERVRNVDQPLRGGHVVDDDGACLEPLEVVGNRERVGDRPVQLGRVARAECPFRPDLDERDVDVPERGGEQARSFGDDLLGRPFLGGEAEDADEQLEPDAVLLPGRDVLHVALRDTRPSVGIGDDQLVVADPDDSSVARDQSVVEVHRLQPGGVPLHDLRQHALAVVGVQRVAEEIGIGEPLLLGVAQQRRNLRADVERRALVVELVDVDDERQPLDELFEIETCHRHGDRSGLPETEGAHSRRSTSDVHRPKTRT